MPKTDTHTLTRRECNKQFVLFFFLSGEGLEGRSKMEKRGEAVCRHTYITSTHPHIKKGGEEEDIKQAVLSSLLRGTTIINKLTHMKKEAATSGNKHTCYPRQRQQKASAPMEECTRLPPRLTTPVLKSGTGAWATWMAPCRRTSQRSASIKMHVATEAFLTQFQTSLDQHIF